MRTPAVSMPATKAVGHVTESVHDRYTRALAESHRAAAEQVAALVASARKP